MKHRHRYKIRERRVTWYEFVCRDCGQRAAMGVNGFWGYPHQDRGSQLFAHSPEGMTLVPFERWRSGK